MRKIKFANDNFYHIYSRGTDKRKIFEDDDDKMRFLDYLKINLKKSGIIRAELHAYCLMENHFHLLFRQEDDDGIPAIMQGLGTSYARYYNKLISRKGHLFEKPYCAEHVNSQSYLWHIFRYIHLNPLNYFQKDWKSEGIKDVSGALKFIQDYKWSSLNYSFNDKHELITTDILRSEFSDLFEYQVFLSDWIKYGMTQKKPSLINLVPGS